MKNLSVQQLRELGTQVRVSHCRKLKFPLRDQGNIMQDYMTRREFEAAGYAKVKFGDVVESTGGFTIVEITTNNQTVRGKYSFGPRPFNRRIGLMAAIGRALK